MEKRRVLVRFGQRVRNERKALGYSQAVLAQKAGCHRTYVGMVERAEKNITLANIQKFAIALKMEISELTEGV